MKLEWKTTGIDETMRMVRRRSEALAAYGRMLEEERDKAPGDAPGEVQRRALARYAKDFPDVPITE